MSNLRRRKYLKTRFEDGDRPDGNDFAELIDSSLNQKSDQIFAVDQMLGIGTKQPAAPLEVSGSNGDLKQSVVIGDGCNSTLKIAHPQNNTVAIGSDPNQSIEIGNFNEQSFTPQVYITQDSVGIGAPAQHAELDVKTSLWVGESIGLSDGTLYFKDGQLYLKAGDQTYLILTKKTNNGQKPFRKWILFLIILGCILLLLLIILIVIYLYKTYGS